MGARSMNISLGMWLFLSTFAWHHGLAQTINASVCGILAVTIALAGLEGRSRARYFNLAVGGWLIASSFFLHATRPGTAVNHVVVGLLIAVLATLPRAAHEPRPQAP